MNDNQAIKRVALYARVSTLEQNTANQINDLRQMAQQRGWEIVGEYKDQISGAQARRPELDRLLDDAHRGHFDVALVWAFDRMARSVPHLLATLDKLNHCGVKFVTLKEGVDTAGPMGRALTTILGAIAELEHSLIRERVKAGMRRAKLEGRHIGRKPLVTDDEQIWEDRTVLRYSLKKIAMIHEISKTSVARILKRYVPKGAPPALPQGLENTHSHSVV